MSGALLEDYTDGWQFVTDLKLIKENWNKPLLMKTASPTQSVLDVVGWVQKVVMNHVTTATAVEILVKTNQWYPLPPLSTLDI